MVYAVETERVTKIFYPPRGVLRLLSKSPLKDKLTAVDEVTLQVNEGEVFGLLGPNGAGKTTLIKMLCTLIRPTSGRASVGGVDVLEAEDAAKRLIGLVAADERSFYWRLTGRENLEFFASLYNIPRNGLKRAVDEVVEQVGLSGAADNMFYSFSSGMKQKLGIARALLINPKVLFLDEPTRSLDPITAQNIKVLIRKQFADSQGRTIFLSTHRLDEAEQLCDRIAIMDKGRILFTGSVDELRRRVRRSERFVVETRNFPEKHLADVALQSNLSNISVNSLDGNGSCRMEFHAADGDDSVSRLLSGIITGGGSVISCQKQDCRLEDLFIDMVKGGHAN
ncbi:MAG TPA: ABC transporter ATP-binding protein [Anaerolineae bacterium]|nr:ABC transporter ATP-binding protein [Anaerolineae bacterium]